MSGLSKRVVSALVEERCKCQSTFDSRRGGDVAISLLWITCIMIRRGRRADEMGQQDGLCEDGEEDYDGNVCEEEYDRSKAAANPPDAIL